MDPSQTAARHPARDQPRHPPAECVLDRVAGAVGTLAVPPDSAEVVEAIEPIKALPFAPGDVVTGDAAFSYRLVTSSSPLTVTLLPSSISLRQR